jgi:hypothetical protein
VTAHTSPAAGGGRAATPQSRARSASGRGEWFPPAALCPPVFPSQADGPSPSRCPFYWLKAPPCSSHGSPSPKRVTRVRSRVTPKEDLRRCFGLALGRILSRAGGPAARGQMRHELARAILAAECGPSKAAAKNAPASCRVSAARAKTAEQARASGQERLQGQPRECLRATLHSMPYIVFYYIKPAGCLVDCTRHVVQSKSLNASTVTDSRLASACGLGLESC